MMTQTRSSVWKLAVAVVAGLALLTANSAVWAQEEATEIAVLKFYDADLDGAPGADEMGIEGWRVALLTADGELLEVAETDENGQLSFVVPSDGQEYLVAEIFPEGNWVNTTPAEVLVTAADGEDSVVEVAFGNVCLGAGEGDARSKGFWRNKHGQALIDEELLAVLQDLCLVDDDGEAFNPESAEELARWLNDARAKNMAYMLSAQLAAMVLNVELEFVDADAAVFAPGVFEDSDFATIGELIDAADASLCDHPFTPAGSEERDLQEALKDALDAANNNASTVQAEPCEVVYPDDNGDDDNDNGNDD